jgi:hypothetical protein
MNEFYIDIEKARERALIGRVTVYLNGIKIDKPTAAKSGKFGFVEFYHRYNLIKNNDPVRFKKRGNVKIKISPKLGLVFDKRVGYSPMRLEKSVRVDD